jgi:hypothetical protein
VSVIVPARSIMAVLVTHVHRYEQGDLDLHSLDRLLERTSRQLDRACWCGEGVCCQAHRKHTNPHKRCILR